jgi:hypothetical protein
MHGHADRDPSTPPSGGRDEFEWKPISSADSLRCIGVGGGSPSGGGEGFLLTADGPQLMARPMPANTGTRDGMRIDWDLPIAMDDGLVLRADVFRPVAEGRYPVIMSYGPLWNPLELHEISRDCFLARFNDLKDGNQLFPSTDGNHNFIAFLCAE